MEINANAQDLLAQIRDYQSRIESVKNGTEISSPIDSVRSRSTDASTVDGSTFSSQLSKAFTSAISEVNDLQNISTNSQNEFQMGGDIPLTEVVMNMQKASIAFEATLQVRNKVLTAYQEIMNMPI